MATTQVKNGFDGGTDDQLLVNPDGSINVNTTGGGGGNVNLTEVGGAPVALGQTVMAGSIPVVIASDQSPIPVVISASGTPFANVVYSEITSVSVGIETLITTYTAPIGKHSYLINILTSGQNIGFVNIYNNGFIIDKQYFYYTGFNLVFDYKTGISSYPGVLIAPGTILKATVTNNGSSSASYNARFMILEVTP
jgi:hypothetical protein